MHTYYFKVFDHARLVRTTSLNCVTATVRRGALPERVVNGEPKWSM